ncbi:DUF6286 domain-containing protein [Amycolatopsis sp. CA-126428]|uniref:DUF6286 domain-containing protein n=1 Tax=Amycolatopsis sp. CA-126428 TaxID=2073158 RepID=UPI000CD0971E|nr:DUF6286 domain-containing protein [Amycolatopsis sp. CA-126428]
MKRRPRRSVPATLTALVLLAGCVVVAAIAVQLILGQAPWADYHAIAAALHGTHWNQLAPALAGGAAAVFGSLMLLCGILPGKRTILPLAGDLESGVSRRSYRSTLRAAASDVDGITGVKLKLKHRKVTVKVFTRRTGTTGLADAVREAISRRVDQIEPATRPAVKVKVQAVRSPS